MERWRQTQIVGRVGDDALAAGYDCGRVVDVAEGVPAQGGAGAGEQRVGSAGSGGARTTDKRLGCYEMGQGRWAIREHIEDRRRLDKRNFTRWERGSDSSPEIRVADTREVTQKHAIPRTKALNPPLHGPIFR